MAKRKNYECLMIETKGKKYFTETKNYPKLIEFSKALKANISVVKVQEAEILNLKDLAPAICSNLTIQKPDFKIIRNKIKSSKKRKQSIKLAATIRKDIQNQFLAGRVVSAKTVATKYKKYNLTPACFCNHVKAVSKTLTSVVKVGAGKYQIKPASAG